MVVADEPQAVTVPVVLPPPLDEFRKALLAEIDAASRGAAAAAVKLHSGQHIAQIGAFHQYLFKVESVLNVPSDSPGQLVVGAQVVEATIVSVEGLNVTVSVEQHLGTHVPAASLRSDLAFLLKKLISRIEDLADKPNPAGSRLLGAQAPSGSATRVSVDGLNAEQNAAVASALGRDTTFVWGPPGTGKTATIGAIGAELHLRGRSLLVVSHTNIAVDQALLHIAGKIDPAELEAGKVLRVGEPRDARLLERPELLLSEQAKRRSDALAARQAELEGLRSAAIDQLAQLRSSLELAQWVEIAGPEIVDRRRHAAALVVSTEAAAQLAAQVTADRHAEPDLSTRRRKAAAAVDAQAQREPTVTALHQATEDVETARQAEADAVRAVEVAKAAAAKAAELRPHFSELAGLPDPIAARETIRTSSHAVGRSEHALQVQRAELSAARALLDEVNAVGGLARRWKRLPHPDEQKRKVDAEQRRAAVLADQLEQTRRELEAAESTAARVQQLTDLVEGYEHFADTDVVNQRLLAAQAALRSATTGHSRARRELTRLTEQQRSLEHTLAEFASQFDRTPQHVLSAVDAELEAIAGRRAELQAAQERNRRQSTELRDWATHAVSALDGWDLLPGAPRGDLEACIDAIESAHATAQARLDGQTVSSIQGKIDHVNGEIVGWDAELAEIEEALGRVQEELVSQATVVATTLTRAYLRDYIQQRRFDTTILDEASMAPIPALWVAASVADHSVVVVGDPKQLPPIKHATTREADRWLGTDVFVRAGIVDDHGNPLGDADHLVRLTTQYRMHPDISRIPADLIYPALHDGPGVEQDAELDGWYASDWGHDAPVVLADTSSLNAWVTTVERGTRTSRLNFLSAALSAHLAAKLLAPDRPPANPGAPPRVLIVTPYRPQADLIEHFVEHGGVADDVAVGTAHSFQGNEASVVILDLVVDEPHWRVGLFTPAHDAGNKRLLNVAVTRAKRRLIVVGDLPYIAKIGKKAFLSRMIRHVGKSAVVVDATDLLAQDFAATAAAAQLDLVGGPLEPHADRMVVTQAHFDRYFLHDLAQASSRIVIYSPFLTGNRIDTLAPHLMAATARGVDVYVFTKSHEDRGKHELPAIRELEDRLTGLGVAVVHKRKMHEKVALIDDAVTWVGSLNPLSFSNTAEVMERRRSRTVVSDYTKALRLDDLLTTIVDEELGCPACGDQLEAAEGDRGPYWRCPGCQYSRNLAQPAPKDGKLPCNSCGSTVTFGKWGDQPAWRCTANSRHRMRVHPSHLQLPKMRALVPRSDLKALGINAVS